MAKTSSKGMFLDVDPTIVENNLRFMVSFSKNKIIYILRLCTLQPDSSEEFNKIFSTPGEQYPSKVVKPFPGKFDKTVFAYLKMIIAQGFLKIAQLCWEGEGEGARLLLTRYFF